MNPSEGGRDQAGTRWWTAPGLVPYFLSQVASQVGGAIYELGVIWYTLQLTESAPLTALVAAATYLPALLSPVLGALSDRAPPKRILVAVEVVRGGLVLLLAAGTWLAGFPPTWIVVPLSLLLGLTLRMYLPARMTWLSQAVPDRDLARANALSSLISNLRLVVGGGVSVLAFALGRPELVFVCAGSMYLLSAVLLRWLSAGPSQARPRRALGSGSVREVVALARDSRLAPVLMLVAFSNLFLVGAWIAGSPLLADAFFRDGRGYAWLQAAYGLGVAAGCLVVGSVVAGAATMARVVVIGYMLRAAAFAGLALSTTDAGLLVAAAVAGLATPAITVVVPTVLQRIGRRIGSVGQIFGLYGLVDVGVISLSILVYGALASRVSLAALLIVPVVAALGLAALAPRVFRRQLEDG